MIYLLLLTIILAIACLFLLVYFFAYKKKKKEPFPQKNETLTAPDCMPLSECNSACKKQSDDWEGWATTTVFGEGETCWPSGIKNAINLKCLNTEHTMGAAIPWRILCKTYGSRQKMLDSLGPVLYDSKKDTLKQCFEVQPISVPPSFLQQGSFDGGVFGGKYDINSDEIVAKDDRGKDYPSYIIYPYQGCGGDCMTEGCPDCFNSCYGSLKTAADVSKIVSCDLTGIDTECCGGMKILSKNQWDVHNKDEFEKKYSYPFAINDSGTFHQDGKVNWCGGFNYHFDIAMNNPLWAKITPDKEKGPFCKSTGDYNNIVVRYRKINCPNPPSSCARC